MEHNAVMRPVVQLASSGISFDRIPCRTDGSMILEKVEELVGGENLQNAEKIRSLTHEVYEML